MLMQQGRKGFRSTSVSHKVIRETSSALKRSPIPVLTSPLPLNFSLEAGTHHTKPQFMKVRREKNDLEVGASLELRLKMFSL